MLVAQQTVDALLVLKIDVSQDTVSFHDFVEDVKIQGQFIYALDLLHEFAANGTPHPKVVVESGKTLGTEGMPAVDEYARYLLTHIEFVAAEVAEV